MCGILGVANSGGPREIDSFEAGLDSLVHRGPESRAVRQLITSRAFCVLGHTRLRIIDTDQRADQPMCEESSTMWITYNGEIYNHKELRRELEGNGHRFTSASDTEVIVHLYEDHRSDVEGMLGHLRGMFAFALFDMRRDRMLVCRDRLGIKPMYWCDGSNGGVAFASEVRALVRAGFASGAPDPRGIGSYLMWGSVHGPATAFEGIRELMPGSYLEWTPEGTRVSRWWTLQMPRVVSQVADATEHMKEALDDAVRRHLIADRPVGIFLSGGVDSGAVARVAARHGAARGLTVTFPEADADEGADATALAKELGLEHVQIPAFGADVARDLPAILSAMDQPTSDGVNSWIVSRAAREGGLVVALSGLGGDELFSGYPSFQLVPRLASISRAMAPLPPGLRDVIGWPFASRRPGSRISRAVSADEGYEGAYAAVRGLLSTRELRRHGVTVPLPEPPRMDSDRDPVDRVTLLEMLDYLPNQLLRDTDQMSMAHSLEVRVPLLDNELVGFVLTVPSQVRAVKDKQFLALASGARPLPKRPFTLPFQRWLTGPLKEVVRRRPSFERIAPERCDPIESRHRLWRTFAGGRVHWSRPWAITVLRLWPQANRLSW